MTRKEAIKIINNSPVESTGEREAVVLSIEALEQEPCDKCEVGNPCLYCKHEFEPKQKIGRCMDCKWWKDSDGLYRRGGHAESQCPINRREVFEGNGYCYMYEPQESEVTDADSD